MADQQEIVDTTLKRPRHEPLEEQGAGAAGQEPVPRKKRQTLTNEEEVAVELALREEVQKIAKHVTGRYKYVTMDLWAANVEGTQGSVGPIGLASALPWLLEGVDKQGKELICDMGCGNGYMIVIFKKLGYSAFGYELKINKDQKGLFLSVLKHMKLEANDAVTQSGLEEFMVQNMNKVPEIPRKVTAAFAFWFGWKEKHLKIVLKLICASNIRTLLCSNTRGFNSGKTFCDYLNKHTDKTRCIQWVLVKDFCIKMQGSETKHLYGIHAVIE